MNRFGFRGLIRDFQEAQQAEKSKQVETIFGR